MPPRPAAVASPSASIEPFRDLLEPAEWNRFNKTMADAAERLRGRRIWNINSTAQGGGVAEMLSWEIPYERGVGLDVRWLVFEGDSAFFTFTKRLHALLHGVSADGSSISNAERQRYEETTARNAESLIGEVREGDVAIVHDPQPAGLIPHLVNSGVHVIWRCHIGVDEPNALAREAWRFLLPAVRAAGAYVFSRQAYVWEGLDPRKVAIIPPAIDAFTPKNQDLTPEATVAILQATGIIEGTAIGDPRFHSRDGSLRQIERMTKMTPATPVPANASLVVQVSRWDRLKDPIGVIKGFGEFVAPHVDTHLIVAGPGISDVADDPEEASVLWQVEACCRSLPESVSRRIRLARLPMADADENAAIVNALQRKAQVVVQKSLREGFGLTVAEAMWKARPVVASRIGGICDQIEDGISGLLVDPTDLKAFGMAVRQVLENAALSEKLGAAARTRVRREFLAPRLLMQQASLVTKIVDRPLPDQASAEKQADIR